MKCIEALISIHFVVVGAAGCIVRAQEASVQADDAADLDAYYSDPPTLGPTGSEAAPCPSDTVPWQRADGLTSCATYCGSDSDCLGFATGDERCRLIASADGTVPAEATFVDDTLSAELDATDGELAANVDAAAADSAAVIVTPECDAECAPMTVPAPVPAVSVRLCDEFWDIPGESL